MKWNAAIIVTFRLAFILFSIRSKWPFSYRLPKFSELFLRKWIVRKSPCFRSLSKLFGKKRFEGFFVFGRKVFSIEFFIDWVEKNAWSGGLLVRRPSYSGLKACVCFRSVDYIQYILFMSSEEFFCFSSIVFLYRFQDSQIFQSINKWKKIQNKNTHSKSSVFELLFGVKIISILTIQLIRFGLW